MAERAHQAEVDRNYETYKRELPHLLASAPGKFVLLHDGEVAETFDTFSDAVKFGNTAFGTGKFSVQEVTSEQVSLGYHSYALHQHSA